MNEKNKRRNNRVFCSQEKTVPMVPLPLAPFLQPDDPDVMFYNEVYHYLSSGSFPEGATDVYKKVIRKRSTNYLVSICL